MTTALKGVFTDTNLHIIPTYIIYNTAHTHRKYTPQKGKLKIGFVYELLNRTVTTPTTTRTRLRPLPYHLPQFQCGRGMFYTQIKSMCILLMWHACCCISAKSGNENSS